MSAVRQNAIKAYTDRSLEQDVMTADPHRLIVMLFDGALKALDQAKWLINAGAPRSEKGVVLSKAIAIIDQGLRASLDKKAGGELAENLDMLYGYMVKQLLSANINTDAAAIDEVRELLSQLRDAWLQIGGKSAAPAQRTAAELAAASYGHI